MCIRDRVSVEQQVLLDAVTAYVNLRLQQALLDLQNSSVDLIGQELQAARDRFEVGEITLTDVSQAEARLAAGQAAVSAAEGNLLVAREVYKATIGHYPDRMSGLPGIPKTAKSKEEAQKVALASHPFIIQSQHQAKVADLQVEIANAAFLPTINGQASGIYGYDGNGNFGVALNLTQPIYQGGGLSALYRKAVSYTHLDVYKRQASGRAGCAARRCGAGDRVRAWLFGGCSGATGQIGDCG